MHWALFYCFVLCVCVFWGFFFWCCTNLSDHMTTASCSSCTLQGADLGAEGSGGTRDMERSHPPVGLSCGAMGRGEKMGCQEHGECFWQGGRVSKLPPWSKQTLSSYLGGDTHPRPPRINRMPQVCICASHRKTSSAVVLSPRLCCWWESDDASVYAVFCGSGSSRFTVPVTI